MFIFFLYSHPVIVDTYAALTSISLLRFPLFVFEAQPPFVAFLFLALVVALPSPHRTIYVSLLSLLLLSSISLLSLLLFCVLLSFLLSTLLLSLLVSAQMQGTQLPVSAPSRPSVLPNSINFFVSYNTQLRNVHTGYMHMTHGLEMPTQDNSETFFLRTWFTQIHSTKLVLYLS